MSKFQILISQTEHYKFLYKLYKLEALKFLSKFLPDLDKPELNKIKF